MLLLPLLSLLLGLSVPGYDADELTQPAPRKRRAVRHPSPPAPAPETVELTPSKDNTLYQSSSGAVSNGRGVHFFAGVTASSEIRRALFAFDLSQIPPGSLVTRVTLKLNVSFTTSGPQRFALHRVNADWGEGTSNAGSVSDGRGVTSTTGDATWTHRFRPSQPWITAGGDFTATEDASAEGDFGEIVFESSPALIARVQGWVDQPSTNFGWMLRGNESRARTAKRFVSREVEPAFLRPALTIEYMRP